MPESKKADKLSLDMVWSMMVIVFDNRHVTPEMHDIWVRLTQHVIEEYRSLLHCWEVRAQHLEEEFKKGRQTKDETDTGQQ